MDVARLKKIYETELVPQLVKRFQYSSRMQVPRLEKIVLNVGVSEAIQNAKALDKAVEELTQISGQKPIITQAKKSIAGFKLRAGMKIGCKVTLRGDRMFEFLDRLVNVALPRVRDFRGVNPKSFDGHGNYTLGLTEQIIFPEINYDTVERLRGFSVSICTSAKTDEEGRELIGLLGMPFRK
jgi:large subunit ribosomal protein L5